MGRSENSSASTVRQGSTTLGHATGVDINLPAKLRKGLKQLQALKTFVPLKITAPFFLFPTLLQELTLEVCSDMYLDPKPETIITTRNAR